MNTKVEEINQYFKVPIFYNSLKKEISQNIITDLELIKTVDGSASPICNFCFNNENDVSLKINEQMVKYYTTDELFLKEYQSLIKEYSPLNVKYTDYSSNYKSIIDIWNELKIESGFKEKYYFIDWDKLEFLNRSQWFLQCMSIYNLMSPLISLFIPIIILIIPFLVIKMKGLSITINEYIQILKMVASTNAIAKLFVVNFSEITAQEKMYMMLSAAFYIFSIYQNFMVCYRFNNNMKTIHNHFNEIRIYIDHTIKRMKNYLKYSASLSSHAGFNTSLSENVLALERIQHKISSITEYNMLNLNKISEIGYVFKCFYELHTDNEYDNHILFSLGFNGYIDCMEGLQQNILDHQMSYATFIKNSKKTVFYDSYYAPLKNVVPIKNTIKLKKNMILTGPNASGKTTILKSVLINILLSQQFGCGFYSSASLKPVEHIHCYLNIPDTSGRDSLFQAEARRCKDILDIIQSHPDDNHFCAFDELYSGTNPEEASQSATAFMQFISKNKNVECLLTTHYIKVCKRLSKSKNILNCRMKTEIKDGHLEYEYILEKGISTIKGGIMVLQEMNYPKEIIDNAN